MFGLPRTASSRSAVIAKAVVGAAVLAVLAGSFGASAAAAGVVVTPQGVVPRAGVPLPALLDATPRYNEQRSCDPMAKPGVEAYASMVLTTYRQGRSGGIVRGCGIGATSEHKEGRAFDWMVSASVPAEKAAGDGLTAWLTGKDAQGVVGGNARRLGVMYVIWNRRIWSTYRIADGWRAYSGPSSHADHVHTSFTWDGAMKRTSWWDGTATADDDSGPCRVYAGQPAALYTTRHPAACTSALQTPPSSPYAIVWPGQSGSSVKVAQAALGVTADGGFGAVTRTALLAWQRTHAVPVTGVLDKPTWAKLVPSGSSPSPTAPPPVMSTTTPLSAYLSQTLAAGAQGPAVVALQRALGVWPSGTLSAATTELVSRLQASNGLAATGVVDPATWAAVQQASYPLLAYRNTVLREGDQGIGVTALQAALKIATDGSFGPATSVAVRAAQSLLGRPVTGVVDGPTWVALEAHAYPQGSAGVALQSVPRLWGATRYDTAASVAATYPVGVDTAYVASGAAFPDALAGAARAAAGADPVLLTAATALPGATRAALERLRPGRIIVLGGPGVVSDVVVQQLAGLTAGGVTRVFGADRYATAAAVSAAQAPGVDSVYLASGAGFADALAGAALAGARRGPILLTQASALPPATLAELKRLRPREIVVLGGIASVSEALVPQLKTLAANVIRLAGPDRFATAAAVATRFKSGQATTYVASGMDFPDALGGAALAGSRGLPVLLVRPDVVPDATANALRKLRPSTMTLLGGPAGVGVDVGAKVDAFRAP